MFGLVSLFTSFIVLSWRYILSALLAGATLLIMFVADKTLVSNDEYYSAQALIEKLLFSTLFNSVLIAICAIPVSFVLIFLGKILSLKSWLYYSIVGAMSAYGALWILVNIFEKNHISLDPNSPELITTIGGGLVAGFIYRILAIR